MDVLQVYNFLSEAEIQQVISILNSKRMTGTHIYFDADIAQKLIEIVGPKLPDYTITNYISIGETTQAIKKHVDPKLDSRVTHKLLVYLSVPESGGGTKFDGFYSKPENGKAVIFKIDLPHSSEPFKGTKRVFGLRLIKIS